MPPPGGLQVQAPVRAIRSGHTLSSHIKNMSSERFQRLDVMDTQRYDPKRVTSPKPSSDDATATDAALECEKALPPIPGIEVVNPEHRRLDAMDEQRFDFARSVKTKPSCVSLKENDNQGSASESTPEMVEVRRAPLSVSQRQNLGIATSSATLRHPVPRALPSPTESTPWRRSEYQTCSAEVDDAPSPDSENSDTASSAQRTFASAGPRSTVQTSLDSNEEGTELVHTQVVKLDTGDEAEMIIYRPWSPPQSPILGCIPRPKSPFSRPTSPIKFGCLGDTQRENFEENVDAMMILKSTFVMVNVDEAVGVTNEERWRDSVQVVHYGNEAEPGTTTTETRIFT